MTMANVADWGITPLSGWGLVNINGGILHIFTIVTSQLGRDDAASMATMTRTDVVENGVGNSCNPRRR